MHAAIMDEQAMLLPAINSSKLACLGVTVDAAKSNLRLAHMLFNNLPPHCVGLVARCLHHQDVGP